MKLLFIKWKVYDILRPYPMQAIISIDGKSVDCKVRLKGDLDVGSVYLKTGPTYWLRKTLQSSNPLET